jgi:hypothetical protein
MDIELPLRLGGSFVFNGKSYPLRPGRNSIKIKAI